MRVTAGDVVIGGGIDFDGAVGNEAAVDHRLDLVGLNPHFCNCRGGRRIDERNVLRVQTEH